MNKELVKKIVKAKQYEYEIIKEIMPTSLRKRVEKFEKDAFNLLKDVAIEVLREEEKEGKEKVTRKVEVDFS